CLVAILPRPPPDPPLFPYNDALPICYPHIARLFSRQLERADGSAQPIWMALTARLDSDLRARVHQVKRLTPTIVEVIVRAPAAARGFQPGQFYRLQDFETLAPEVEGTRLQMEGL